MIFLTLLTSFFSGCFIVLRNAETAGIGLLDAFNYLAFVDSVVAISANLALISFRTKAAGKG